MKSIRLNGLVKLAQLDKTSAFQILPKSRGIRDAVRCGAVVGYFQYRTLRCGLTKIIIAPHLVFAVICAVWCGLEFSQNHNRIALHFCSYMCDTMYKMRFEVSIFFKFWVFPTQPKTNFSLFLGQDVHEIYTTKYSHIYIFSLTFMLFCD